MKHYDNSKRDIFWDIHTAGDRDIYCMGSRELQGEAAADGTGSILHQPEGIKEDRKGGETGMNKELHDKVLKISDLCIRVNHPNGPTIFTDYAGHTDGFTVQIFSEGWEGERLPDKVYRIYLDGDTVNILETDECLKYLEFLEAKKKKEAFQKKKARAGTRTKAI